MAKSSADKTDSRILPYGLDRTDFNLRLTGRYGHGGTVEFLQGESVVDFVILPPVEWAAMALLVKAGLDSRSVGWPAGFVTTEKLAKELYSQDIIDDRDPNLVVKSIHRLRNRMSSTSFAREADAAPLGKRLIENQRFLGYRVSVSPAQLELYLLDEE